MGPSWYWMPDVFDRFFADFGKKTTDYYELIKLSPAYRVYFGVDEFITIADNLAEIEATLNPLKKGAALSCTNL
jgi:phytoene desaturase